MGNMIFSEKVRLRLKVTRDGEDAIFPQFLLAQEQCSFLVKFITMT
jgi:hypothetical protein